MRLAVRFKYLLLILGMTYCFQGVSAEEIRVHRTIQWDGVIPYQAGSTTMNLLMFEDAVNHDAYGLLPVFFERFPIQSKQVNASVRIENEVYEPLLLPAGTDIEGLNLISGDVQLSTPVMIARGQPFLTVYLLPIKKDMLTGEFQKLVSFDLVADISVIPEDHGPSRSVYTEHSVLNTGRWFKFAINNTGIHKITYNELNEMGLDAGSIDPRNIRIYGNGNGMLPEPNSMARYDDLLENAILVVGEEDGSFDPDDHILFYGMGPTVWKYSKFYQLYNHIYNLYTEETYYFITADLGPGKRIPDAPPEPQEPTYIIDKFDDYQYYESDEINLIKSGKEWYGEVFSEFLSYDFDFYFPDLDLESPVKLKINFAARSTEESEFTVYAIGEEIIREAIAPINLNSVVYARASTPNIVGFMPQDENIDITVEYNKPVPIATGWLNYIELNVTSHLIFHNGQLLFRYAGSVGDSSITQFELSGAGNEVRFWDVTHFQDVSEIDGFDISGGRAIRLLTDTLREFLAFDGTGFYQVSFVEEVQNQDLHACANTDMIIVTHPLFMDQAKQLADHHRTFDALSVLIVTPQQVYNEFSSGAQDVSAIRDFVKMLYDRAPRGTEPAYLLMFGDGSYDYKERVPDNSNFVPTFQSKESLKHALSFLTDDYFGCFDLSEGSNAAGTVDIGIGRFPVRSVEQAQVAVDKVIHYSRRAANVMGEWRNRICLVADDGDFNVHLKQAEELAVIIDTIQEVYNINKIYLDAYTQVSTPSGNRYPEVNKAIDKAVMDGALIVNYTGHGGELGWADEYVLDIPTINSWKNIDNMPVFMTATCEFSRFDDPGLTSGGELIFLSSEGAGIALFTTTRLAYSQSNFGMNKKFYLNAFDTVDGSYQRLGDLIRHAKTPSGVNIRNIVLLGDPALMLAYPQKNVSTLRIYDEYARVETDTLKALSKITVNGKVTDHHGIDLQDFNGLLYPIVYDKPSVYSTLGNDYDSKITDFLLQNKVLYKGKVTVQEGAFTYSFIVPKDIAYQVDTGKISYYVYDTVNYRDGHGLCKPFVGSVNMLAPQDNKGPDLELFINHTQFRSGDITANNPVMLAYLYDESGLNTVGNSIGHDITGVLDGNENNPFILNDYFEPDQDSYEGGRIRYPLGFLENGQHTLKLKAWDVYNNSSETEIQFMIDENAPVDLSMVYNYPNPFSHTTTFTFRHRKPGQQLDIKIYIYNITGQLVTILEDSFSSEFLISDPIVWNGRNEGGDLLSSGMYIYKVIVKSEMGQVESLTNKMMIIR